MGLLSRFRRRKEAPAPSFDPDDPTLVVLVDAGDPAVADSTVLAEAAARGVDVERHLLVRHRVVRVADHDGFAGQLDEGYAVRWDGDDARVSRTEVPSAMSLSRERSRMAGLAQRFGGDVEGYELLAPSDDEAEAGGSVGSAP